MFLTVGQIEPVVEVGRIDPLIVLKNGLQLVQCLYGFGFGRCGILILLPKREDLGLVRLIERACEMQQVGLFLLAFVRMLVFLDGRNVSVNRFAQIMHKAHFQQLEHVHAGQFVLECHRHQAQAPSMFGGTLRPACRRVCASEHALELFRFLQKGQTALDLVDIHARFYKDPHVLGRRMSKTPAEKPGRPGDEHSRLSRAELRSP
ncbi:hypothetical protein SDC9_126767 [bioreactor metagenome]|uniref:Uncharacterized protein n=1 Tax=bioreactor metagenome TaxID=1076179 RepID=A0A645CS31_9ZZZZ